MATEITNKPVATLRDRNLKVVIWKNSSEKGDFYTADAVRGYRTDDGWHDSRSFGENDLLIIARLIERAYDQVVTLRRQDAKAAENAMTSNPAG